MFDKTFLSTKEVAEFLDVNEKMIYTLISEKGLPATKITGKWLFPRHLVEQWLEQHIINYPKSAQNPGSQHVLILVGSHDVLLERAIHFFNRLHPELVAVFGNVGSLGGLKLLRQGGCHIATSHLLEDDEQEYNFTFAQQELGAEIATVINFCQREQGIFVAKGNPKEIRSIADFARADVTISNRPANTGTRWLLDREIRKIGLRETDIRGYQRECQSHSDVAIEILSGHADAGIGIRAAAELFHLDFLPLRWERYDLLIAKHRYFEEGVQLFLRMLQENELKMIANELHGYDLSLCGQMMFQHSQQQDIGY